MKIHLRSELTRSFEWWTTIGIINSRQYLWSSLDSSGYHPLLFQVIIKVSISVYMIESHRYDEFKEGSKQDPTIVQALSLYDGRTWLVSPWLHSYPMEAEDYWSFKRWPIFMCQYSILSHRSRLRQEIDTISDIITSLCLSLVFKSPQPLESETFQQKGFGVNCTTIILFKRWLVLPKLLTLICSILVSSLPTPLGVFRAILYLLVFPPFPCDILLVLSLCVCVWNYWSHAKNSTITVVQLLFLLQTDIHVLAMLPWTGWHGCPPGFFRYLCPFPLWSSSQPW